MSLKISQIEGWKFKADLSGVTLISGQETRDSDYTGLSPGKLMTAALGMCTGMHAVSYLKENDVQYSDLEISMKTKGAGSPARYGDFYMDISVKTDLSDEQYKGLIEECNRCFVGNTLKNSPEINIKVRTV